MNKNSGFRSYPLPIGRARDFIESHIDEISSVRDAAAMMGYSRSYFSVRVREHFDTTPGAMIRKARFQRLVRAIHEHPGEKSYAVARRIGLGDEQALYKFLNRHWDTNFTRLRERILAHEDGLTYQIEQEQKR